jgi:hypothetical protein
VAGGAPSIEQCQPDLLPTGEVTPELLILSDAHDDKPMKVIIQCLVL